MSNRDEKYISIRQRHRTACGEACLRMVAAYWNHEWLPDLEDYCANSNILLSLYDLTLMAQKLGFVSEARGVTFEHLLSIPLPLIAHVRGNHYIMVTRVTGCTVEGIDPVSGPFNITSAEFLRRWHRNQREQGIVLLIQPEYNSGLAPIS